MYYIFYKTTNLVNGKVYYGVHKTENLNDGYLGSGVAIKAAIKKYGRCEFIRETIRLFEDRESMYAYEREFVTKEIVGLETTYNQTIGGFGGFSHIDNYGDKNPMKDPDVVRKCVESHIKNNGYKTDKHKTASKHNLQKACDVNLGKKRPEHSDFMKSQMQQHWKNNRESIRDSLSSYFCLTSPSGVEYRTNRLQEFCKDNNLPYTTIWSISVTGVAPKRGKSKGWNCMKET